MDTKTQRLVVQRTISLGLKTQRFVELRHDKRYNQQPRWSNTINNAVEDLSALCAASVPELSEAAWYEVVSAYNGHFFDNPICLPLRLASDVADNYGLTHERIQLIRQRGDEDEMMRTINAIDELSKLSQIEQYAVHQIARLFWHNGDLGSKSASLLDTIYACAMLLSSRYDADDDELRPLPPEGDHHENQE